jgi:CO dehydrogenase/acetyl-CoA synthase alpha subunit
MLNKVKTQWISSSLKLSPAFLVLHKKCFLKYRIDSVKTVSANIDLPFSSKDEVHWVLTIPAIWKDDSKQFMRESTKQVFNNAAQKKNKKLTN